MEYLRDEVIGRNTDERTEQPTDGNMEANELSKSTRTMVSASRHFGLHVAPFRLHRRFVYERQRH